MDYETWSDWMPEMPFYKTEDYSLDYNDTDIYYRPRRTKYFTSSDNECKMLNTTNIDIDFSDIPEKYHDIYQILYIEDAKYHNSLYASSSYIWNLVLQNYKLPEIILDRFSHHFDWAKVSSYQKMSFEFAKAHNVTWALYLLNQATEEEDIEKVLEDSTLKKLYFKSDIFDINEKFSYISKRKNLSKEFITKYLDKLNWDIVSYNINLDIDIISISKDYIDWKILTNRLLNTNYSRVIDIFKKYPEKIYWDAVSSKFLSIQFMTEFKDKLNWHIISNFAYDKEEILDTFQDKIDWTIISTFGLNAEKLRKYKSRLNWEFCSESIRTQELLEEFKDVVVWNKLDIRRLILPENILEQYFDKFSKNDISRYQKLSEAFIRRHAAQLNLNSISTYQNISEDFREEFDLI